jgi:uncharacterized membrane protein
MKSFVVINQLGCLLPFLLIFNLFFGWLFFRPIVWLLIGLILILLFILNSLFITKKVSTTSYKKDVVDVEAEVLKDEPYLKG